MNSVPVPTKKFLRDACPIGRGAFFLGDWFHINWANNYSSFVNMHINLQETFTVSTALECWMNQLCDTECKLIIVQTTVNTPCISRTFFVHFGPKIAGATYTQDNCFQRE